jgi:guanylate kinase
VGKGTLIRALLERLPGLQLSISATTRDPRPGELDGRDYYFMSEEEFEKSLQRGDFLEHATFAGKRYGTPRSELERAGQADTEEAGAGRAAGEGVIGLVLEIDLQGARQVREALPEAVQVFIAPPSAEALRARLVGRGADTPEQIDERLAAAERELQAQPEFEHVVVNDRLEQAVEELVDLVARIWARKSPGEPA